MVDFFNKIVDYLTENNIPYMLSGSIAMGVYITPRATRDIDFVVHLRNENIDSFILCFEGEYYCSRDAVKDAIERQSIFNVIDHASGFKADFVIRKNEEYRLVEFERRRLIQFNDIFVYVVSPEDLIISKLIWIQNYQFAVQKDDIKNLLELPDVDVEYVHRWIKKLRLNTFDLL